MLARHLEHVIELRNDMSSAEQHGRDEYCCGTIVDGIDQPPCQCPHRLGAFLDDLEQALLGQSVELSAEGMEFPVGGHEPRPLTQRQGREKTNNELVRVRTQSDVAVPIAEQPGEATSHP